MKKLFLFVFLAFLVPNFANAASYSRVFPETKSQAVRVFADQLPINTMTEAQIQFAARNYSGSQKLYARQADLLRQYTPNFLVLHYRLAQAAGPAAGIAHDVEENQGLDGNNFSSQEWDQNLQSQDWFIKNSDGVNLRNTQWNWYPFDLGRSETLRNQIADYWIQRVQKETVATKSEGVFADSFGLVFGPWQTSGAKPYMFDTNWNIDPQSAKSWLFTALVPYSDRIWKALQTSGIYYIPNCGQLITSWDTIENYTHSDGCMVEGFTGFDRSIQDVNDWKLEMNNILALQNKGKVTIAQTSVESSDMVRRSFILGSYLVSKGEKSYLNMLTGGVTLEWYPEYDLSLGSYTSAIQTVDALTWNGVFRRNFENGFVLVNPYSEVKNIRFDAPAQKVSFSGGGEVPRSGAKPGSLAVQEVNSISLAPQSAAFFLTTNDNSRDQNSVSYCPLTRDHAYKSSVSNAVYYVDIDCKKRPFKNSALYFTYFDSWNKGQQTAVSNLNLIPNHELGFMPFGPLYDPKYGALVKTVTDPKVYFLLNGKKYWITSEATFIALNYKWNWVEDIDPRLLDKYPSGGEITDTSRHLDGTVIKYVGDASVYILENGKKRHIANEAEFNASGYRWDRIVTLKSSEQYKNVEVPTSSPDAISEDDRRIIIRAK